jgi:hypothetical protein
MFNIFPKIDYQISSYDTVKSVDLNVSAKVKDFFAKYKLTSVRPYYIDDGESPDMVSFKVYGTPKYGYLVMMTNNIHSLYDEWPKSSTAFKKYIIEKYGSMSTASTTDLYFYTGEKLVISEESWSTLTDDNKKYKETIMQYEQRVNTEKSFIKILDYKYVIQFEASLQEILGR